MPDDIEYKVQMSASKQPAFHDPPSCPFYEYPLGDLSPYGSEAVPLLDSLIGAHGKEKCIKLHTTTTDAGTFDGPRFNNASAAAYAAYKGRLNSVMKKFTANVQAGKGYPDAAVEDDQAHGMVKIPLIVARFAGQPQLEGHVRAAVATHQRTSNLVANLTVATAKLLEFVVLGHGGVRDALRWGLGGGPGPGALDPASAELLQAVVDAQDAAFVDAVGTFGRNCHLPGNWQAAMHCMLTASGYQQAVEGNILAGAHVVVVVWCCACGTSSATMLCCRRRQLQPGTSHRCILCC